MLAIITAVASPIIHIAISYGILSRYSGNSMTDDMPNGLSAVEKSNETFSVTGTKCCPKCGGNHLQVVNESNTSGGGFSASNGCCGYILLGPLGLLCGTCGSKTKTTNKTFFVCMDCGNKFAG